MPPTELTADTATGLATAELGLPLAPFGLSDLLRQLSTDGATGVLAVRSRDITNRIFVEQGMLVAASPGAPEGRIGQTLVRLGALELDDVEAAAELSDGQPIGQYLLDNQLVTEDQLRSALAEQVRFTVRSMIGWRDGRHGFSERPTGLGDLPLPELSMADVIVDAARTMESVDEVRDLLDAMSGRLAPVHDAALCFQDIRLSPAEGHLLSRLDGNTELSEVILLSSLDEAESWRLLYGFVAAGLVGADGQVATLGAIGQSAPASDAGAAAIEDDPFPLGAPQPVPIEASREPTEPIVSGASPAVDPEPVPGAPEELSTDATYYELLGVAPEASADELERAFRARARSHHPDRASTPSQRSVLEETFARICRARRILTEPERRTSYDEYLQATSVSHAEEAARANEAQAAMAKELMAAGASALRNYDFTAASSYLERARKLAPNNVKCQILLAETQCHNSQWFDRSRQMLEDLIERYEWNIEARLALARLLAKANKVDDAYMQYKAILDLEPGNRVAEQGMTELKKAGGKTIRQSVRSLFGKK